MVLASKLEGVGQSDAIFSALWRHAVVESGLHDDPLSRPTTSESGIHGENQSSLPEPSPLQGVLIPDTIIFSARTTTTTSGSQFPPQQQQQQQQSSSNQSSSSPSGLSSSPSTGSGLQDLVSSLNSNQNNNKSTSSPSSSSQTRHNSSNSNNNNNNNNNASGVTTKNSFDSESHEHPGFSQSSSDPDHVRLLKGGQNTIPAPIPSGKTPWSTVGPTEASKAQEVAATLSTAPLSTAQWFFTSLTDGVLKRKRPVNTTPAAIFKTLAGPETKGRPGTGGVVACWVATAPAPFTGEQTTTVAYFTPLTLAKFLANPIPGPGMLQRFIAPQSDRNNMIRATWSPRLCMLERRINVRKMSDGRVDPYSRAVTYEGAAVASNIVPMNGRSLIGAVQASSSAIARHLTALLAEETLSSDTPSPHSPHHDDMDASPTSPHDPIRTPSPQTLWNMTKSVPAPKYMILNFKIDSKDRLWFMWASAVHLSTPLDAAVASSALSSTAPSAPSKLLPIGLPAPPKMVIPSAPTDQTSHDIIRKTESKPRSGPTSYAGSKDAYSRAYCCPQCSKDTIVAATFDVTFKMAMCHWAKTSADKAQTQERPGSGLGPNNDQPTNTPSASSPKGEQSLNPSDSASSLSRVTSASSSGKSSSAPSNRTSPTPSTPSEAISSSRPPSSSTQVPHSAKDDSWIVPDVLKKVAPGITAESFRKLARSAGWTSRTFKVCETCALDLSEASGLSGLDAYPEYSEAVRAVKSTIPAPRTSSAASGTRVSRSGSASSSTRPRTRSDPTAPTYSARAKRRSINVSSRINSDSPSTKMYTGIGPGAEKRAKTPKKRAEPPSYALVSRYTNNNLQLGSREDVVQNRHTGQVISGAQHRAFLIQTVRKIRQELKILTVTLDHQAMQGPSSIPPPGDSDNEDDMSSPSPSPSDDEQQPPDGSRRQHTLEDLKEESEYENTPRNTDLDLGKSFAEHDNNVPEGGPLTYRSGASSAMESSLESTPRDDYANRPPPMSPHEVNNNSAALAV